jgi:aspartyl-tRNA(Asn)/glutamyl-tRNA(Gln) amidotransferase subunit B
MSKTPSILDHYPDYELNIGIEVHVQLTTNSKIFCPSENHVSKSPNTNICNICTAQPGSLPVLNKKVVEYAIKAGLATRCQIAPQSAFARKHYFYPDLPKNYQISQNEDPICSNGSIPIRLEDGSIKNIRLIRIHMEEDAGKNIHVQASPEGYAGQAAQENASFVDFNRTGTPLLEIVSHPDISSTYEAKAYLRALRLIVQYLGICSGNMEEGAFRADTNVSVRKKGAEKLGTRTELKNINSFKFIGDAVEHEIERQIQLLESGQKVRQETRLWDTKNKKTIMMRSKEEAADYRYFQDPDLPILEVSTEMIDAVKKQMPELPHDRFDRYITKNGLTPYEAEILIDDIDLSNYYEQAHKINPSKQIVNLILRDVMGYLKESKIPLNELKMTPDKLASLVTLLEKGIINNRAAQEVFVAVCETGQSPEQIVKDKNLEQMGSVEELEAMVKELLAANAAQVADYKAGNVKLFGFFVGQMMQKTKGKGDPKIIQELLKKHLS